MLSRQLLAVVNKQCRSFDGSQRRGLMTWHTTHTRKQFKSFAVESIDPLHKLYVPAFRIELQLASWLLGNKKIFCHFREETNDNTTLLLQQQRTNIYEAQYHNQIEIIAFSNDTMETGHCAILRLSFAVPFAQCKWIPRTTWLHTTENQMKKKHTHRRNSVDLHSSEFILWALYFAHFTERSS